jgi:hypothetical protein
LLNLISFTGTDYIDLYLKESMFKLYEIHIQNEETKIAESVVWILSNLAGEGVKYRDAIVAHELLFNKLFGLCNKDVSAEMERQLSYLFSCLVKGKPELNLESLKKCMEAVEIFFKKNDIEVKRDAAWGFSSISDSDVISVQRFLIDRGLVQDIITMDKHILNEMIIPSIRIIGNLLSKTDKIADVLNIFI